jgi:hypothetical protein
MAHRPSLNCLLLTSAVLLPTVAFAQDGLPARSVPGVRPAGIGAGVVLAEAAHGALEGNSDAVRDAAKSPLSPEFIVQIALFDASLRGSGALANRLPGKSALGTALKSNLALAGALTVASAVQVDLAGFTLGDAVHGDFEKLDDASIGVGAVDPQNLGITLGAFAVAQPVWTGIKRASGYFGRRLATRFLRTAAVKGALAVAPVPGSRVVALALTVGDVAMAAFDLAGLLVVGQAMERPAREWNDDRRASNEITERARTLAEATRSEDLGAIDAALAMTGSAFDTQRNLAYMPVAADDLALVRRLRRDGEDPERLEALAQDVFSNYGTRLSLPAQTRALLDEYEARVADARGGADAAIPGGDLDAFAAAIERHRERQEERLDKALRQRSAFYATERAFYEQLRDQAKNDAVRARLQEAIDDLDAVADVEADLFAPPPAPVGPGNAPGLVEAFSTLASRN